MKLTNKQLQEQNERYKKYYDEYEANMQKVEETIADMTIELKSANYKIQNLEELQAYGNRRTIEEHKLLTLELATMTGRYEALREIMLEAAQ